MTGFPRHARLRSGKDFQRSLKAGRRGSGRWFTVSVVANPGGGARLGIVIGRRVLPLATRRNRIKRVTRELFRRLAADLDQVDVVVRLRNPLLPADMPAAEAEVQRLLGDLG